MKKYIFTAVLLTSAVTTYAQQLQTSSMYDMQGLLHNPSLAGVQQDDNIKAVIGTSYRQQWSGISGAPQTVTVFGSFQLPKQKIGIGGYMYNDQTGPTSRTGIQLSLAKHIVFNDGGIFSLGIESRFQQYAIDRAKLSQSIANDPVLGTSDNRFKYDAGFGMSYSNKQWQLGASVSQLVQSKLDFYSGNLTRTEEARLYRHYYFHGKYNWNVDGTTTITPNLMVIYLPNAPTEVVGGARVEHNQLLWWGLGYRSTQSWILSAGLHIKQKFTLGYSYDIYRNPVGLFNGGSNAHEFLLRYNFIK
jgi:type IX secretion system PorP/SprF family membrane protein